MVGGEWCFRLRGVARAAGAVRVLATPCDRVGVEGGGVAAGARSGESVWSSGGPGVNQMMNYNILIINERMCLTNTPNYIIMNFFSKLIINLCTNYCKYEKKELNISWNNVCI